MTSSVGVEVDADDGEGGICVCGGPITAEDEGRRVGISSEINTLARRGVWVCCVARAGDGRTRLIPSTRPTTLKRS